MWPRLDRRCSRPLAIHGLHAWHPSPPPSASRFGSGEEIDVISGATLSSQALCTGVERAAMLLKLTSPGPTFFPQTRIGLNGRPFTIYKLRTMHVNAPKYAAHPSQAGDPRVFPVGRWLRRGLRRGDPGHFEPESGEAERDGAAGDS